MSGVHRDLVCVTNALKHFKFICSEILRLHQKALGTTADILRATSTEEQLARRQELADDISKALAASQSLKSNENKKI